MFCLFLSGRFTQVLLPHVLLLCPIYKHLISYMQRKIDGYVWNKRSLFFCKFDGLTECQVVYIIDLPFIRQFDCQYIYSSVLPVLSIMFGIMLRDRTEV